MDDSSPRFAICWPLSRILAVDMDSFIPSPPSSTWSLSPCSWDAPASSALQVLTALPNAVVHLLSGVDASNHRAVIEHLPIHPMRPLLLSGPANIQ